MSEQPVWGHLLAAGQMLGFAEAHTRELDQVTFRLTGGPATERRKEDVWRTYLAWLVVARQVAVSVDKAGHAAGRPPQFTSWWNGLADHPTHAFFRAQRNAALKEAADPIVTRPLSDNLAYWTFPYGPHAGDPLVARCQQYNDWLYYEMWVPAARLLFPWSLAERRLEAVALT